MQIKIIGIFRFYSSKNIGKYMILRPYNEIKKTKKYTLYS